MLSRCLADPAPPLFRKADPMMNDVTALVDEVGGTWLQRNVLLAAVIMCRHVWIANINGFTPLG